MTVTRREKRYCPQCRADTDHDVERAGARLTERHATCLECGRVSKPQKLSRRELANGGMGDMTLRMRRARHGY